MKSNQNVIFTALLIVLLSACATATKPPAPVIEIKPDQSEPTLPEPAMSPITPVKATIQRSAKLAAPIALPARGSLESVVKKMEANPYSLYWKEKNAYTYYIGGILRAEYKIDAGLTVKEEKGDNSGVVCQFGSDNQQIDTRDVCSRLMLTLDDELGE